jgi:hypothetical protein
VRTKRAKWSPAANSRLCSQHFQTEDFESPFVTIPGTDFVSRSVLRKGAVPSIHKTPEPSNYDKHGQSQDSVDPTHPSSTRKHRCVSTIFFIHSASFIHAFCIVNYKHAPLVWIGCKRTTKRKCCQNQ